MHSLTRLALSLSPPSQNSNPLVPQPHNRRLVPFSFTVGTARMPTVSAYVSGLGESRQKQRVWIALQPLVYFLGCHGAPTWRNIRRSTGLTGHLMEVPELPASFTSEGAVKEWLKKKRKESRWELIDLEGAEKVHVLGGLLIPAALCGPDFTPSERRQILGVLEKLGEFIITAKENLSAAFSAMYPPGREQAGGAGNPSGPAAKVEAVAHQVFGQTYAPSSSASVMLFGANGPGIPPLPLEIAANLPGYPAILGGQLAQQHAMPPAPGPGSFAHVLFSGNRDPLAPSMTAAEKGSHPALEVGDKRRADVAFDSEGAGGLGGALDAGDKRPRYDIGPKPQEPKVPDSARSPYIMYKEYCMDQARQDGRNPGEAGRIARAEWDRAGCGSELHTRWEHASREDQARYARETEVYNEQMREVAAWEMQDYAQKLKQAVDDSMEEPLRILLEEIQSKLTLGGRLYYAHEVPAFAGQDALQQHHTELIAAVNSSQTVSRGLTLQAGQRELVRVLEKLRRAAYAHDLEELRRSLSTCEVFNRKFGSALREGAAAKAAEFDTTVDAAIQLQKRLEGEEADRRMTQDLRRMAKGKRDDELMAHSRDYRECAESCIALLHEVGRLWDDRARQGHRLAQENAQRHQQSEVQVKTVKKSLAKALRDQILHLPTIKSAPRTVSASSANIDEELFKRIFPEAQGTSIQINNPSLTFNVSHTYFSKNLRNGGYITMETCSATLAKDGTLKVTGVGKRTGPIG